MGVASKIFVVCTGNVCRSPYTEYVLRAALNEMANVQIESAGTHALVGQPVDPGTAELLASRGIEAGSFVARQFTPAMAVEAGLILTATRDQRREVVQVAPVALRRTLTLLDFSDLAHALTTPPGGGLAAIVEQLPSARAKVTARANADIIDPFARPTAVFEQMAAQVDAELPAVVAAIRKACGAG